MLTTASSRAPSRARLLSAANTTAMSQTRSFRLGRWSSYPRHRRHIFRSFDSTSRKLSWDQSPNAEDPRAILRKLMGRYWDPSASSASDSNPLGRYIDIDKIKSWSDELSGLRPGRNIEDVERSAINHLFQGHRNANNDFSSWESPLDNVRDHMAKQRARQAASDQQKAQATQASSAADFVAIDPITNRRTTSSPAETVGTSGASAPVHSENAPPSADDLARYQFTSRAHFVLPESLREAPRSPVHSDGGPSPEELEKYSRIEIDPQPWVQAAQQAEPYDDLAKYKPVMNAELDAKAFGPSSQPHEDLTQSARSSNEAPAPGSAPPHADLDKYGPIKWREPGGLPAMTTEEQSKKYSDLNEYRRPVRWNEPDGLPDPTPEENSKKYDDLDKYRPVRWQEPDGLPEPTAEEKSKAYKDLHKYGQVKHNEPDGQIPPTAEELSKNYPDLHRYGSVMWNEPDGNLPPTSEELSKQYTDLHQYHALRFNEPDGQLPPSAEELSKQYDDLHKYESFRWNEPDGKLAPTAEELSKNYADLHLYSRAVVFNEPDGQLPPSSEELSKNYTDLHNYAGPVMWNEPDGQPATAATEEINVEELRKKYADMALFQQPAEKWSMSPEEQAKQYEDLSEYKPVTWNEPDGNLPPTAEERSKLYEDLDKYDQPIRWNEPDGKPAPTAEERSKQYKDLQEYEKPVEWNEPDGKPAPTAEEKSKQYGDLHQYKAVKFNEPHGKLPPSSEELSKRYEDLPEYQQPVRWNEPDGKLPPTAEEKSKRYEDLGRYDQPVRWNEPDGKLPPTSEEGSKRYQDLHQYQRPVHWNEPNGLPTMTPEEASKQYQDLDHYEATKWNVAEDQAAALSQETYNDLDTYGGAFYKDPKADSAAGVQRRSMEKDMSQHSRNWDNANKSARTTVKQAKIKSASQKEDDPFKQPTFNYAKEFPEEFSVSWSPILGEQSASASFGVQGQENPEFDISSFDESFPKLQNVVSKGFDSKPSARLEPSLNRMSTFSQRQSRLDHARAALDQYSIEPQGLETSYMEECGGRSTMPTFVRTYGTVSDAASEASKAVQAQAKQTAAAAASSFGKENNQESTTPAPAASQQTSNQYKILAYDPTTESVTAADTTSIIEDESSPKSAPEVLLRLAHPTKFFPHLPSLHAQGFEIVSGNENILVFRKVREGQAVSEASSKIEQPTNYQPPRVNPIDMTGSQPFTPHSYSASPTGYISYDEEYSAGAEESKPLPPFRAKRQRRFSTSAVEGGPKKGRSRGKKVLVGAATVGGLSYAAGVVGEFFKTGGRDGKGPSSRF